MNIDFHTAKFDSYVTALMARALVNYYNIDIGGSKYRNKIMDMSPICTFYCDINDPGRSSKLKLI